MKVYSYIRVSGKGQVGGEGPDRQRESISAFCAGKAQLIGEFFEAGVSGTVEGMDRPKFSEMIEAIENRRLNGEEINGIVVERLDRIARDLMVQEMLLSECRKRAISVYSADSDWSDIASDAGDPTRKLIRQVLGAVAEFDKSQTVLKLRKARQAVKNRLGRCEGRKPYGVTPEEQAILKVLQIFVRPEHTIQEVADILNQEGLRTRFGTEWNRKSAFRIMKVAGVWTRKDQTEQRLKNLKGNHGRSVSSICDEVRS
jgi:DNA invertase Pin-like site-specific DNA recombinase